jgi:hypothetical protein
MQPRVACSSIVALVYFAGPVHKAIPDPKSLPDTTLHVYDSNSVGCLGDLTFGAAGSV